MKIINFKTCYDVNAIPLSDETKTLINMIYYAKTTLIRSQKTEEYDNILTFKCNSSYFDEHKHINDTYVYKSVEKRMDDSNNSKFKFILRLETIDGQLIQKIEETYEKVG